MYNHTHKEIQLKRYGQIIQVKEEKITRYKQLHSEVWPDVKKKITECNIRNYSIFLIDNLLFSYFEYIGNDYESDMKLMAADSVTQKWWEECNPCQKPIESASKDTWWQNMEEVFHQD